MDRKTQRDPEEIADSKMGFRVSQRIHAVGDPQRTGTVRYVGSVEGYDGCWVGVDWDDGQGKHDGAVNGVRYFSAKGSTTASLIRPRNLSSGIAFMEALRLRYRGESTREEEEEMYVLSSSNHRVSVQFPGKEMVWKKLSRLEELQVASLCHMGISFVGQSIEISSSVPNLKVLDLTGNLLSSWKEISIICEAIPGLQILHLSSNLMEDDPIIFTPSESLHTLVLNNCGITWELVESLKQSLSKIEELHLMKNRLKASTLTCTPGFDRLRILNMEDNCISSWDEILKLSHLRRLEQLHLNRNKLKRIFYPRSQEVTVPFENLECLLLGWNEIEDLASIDALSLFPKLKDVRLSGNPVADPARGGIPRFTIIARLSNIIMLNGSEVTYRERKEAEIRYVRLVMTKEQFNDPEEMERAHPRLSALKIQHGIDDEKPQTQSAGAKKMASELISLTLKCVGPSMGEKPPSIRKLPPSTTVGKLKVLCESFFKLKSIKLLLFLQEEGSPFPLLLDDDSATLVDFGIGTGTTILVDEEMP
ncbi:tubulin folding cofactor E / Pfifferling (PFI) [Wolffia australiana]